MAPPALQLVTVSFPKTGESKLGFIMLNAINRENASAVKEGPMWSVLYLDLILPLRDKGVISHPYPERKTAMILFFLQIISMQEKISAIIKEYGQKSACKCCDIFTSVLLLH